MLDEHYVCRRDGERHQIDCKHFKNSETSAPRVDHLVDSFIYYYSLLDSREFIFCMLFIYVSFRFSLSFYLFVFLFF